MARAEADEATGLESTVEPWVPQLVTALRELREADANALPAASAGALDGEGAKGGKAELGAAGAGDVAAVTKAVAHKLAVTDAAAADGAKDGARTAASAVLADATSTADAAAAAGQKVKEAAAARAEAERAAAQAVKEAAEEAVAEAEAEAEAAAAAAWAELPGGSAVHPYDARVLEAKWITRDEDGRKVRGVLRQAWRELRPRQQHRPCPAHESPMTSVDSTHAQP